MEEERLVLRQCHAAAVTSCPVPRRLATAGRARPDKAHGITNIIYLFCRSVLWRHWIFLFVVFRLHSFFHFFIICCYCYCIFLDEVRVGSVCLLFSVTPFPPLFSARSPVLSPRPPSSLLPPPSFLSLYPSPLFPECHPSILFLSLNVSFRVKTGQFPPS